MKEMGDLTAGVIWSKINGQSNKSIEKCINKHTWVDVTVTKKVIAKFVI